MQNTRGEAGGAITQRYVYTSPPYDTGSQGGCPGALLSLSAPPPVAAAADKKTEGRTGNDHADANDYVSLFLAPAISISGLG